jgi:hypothetical protein
MNKQRTIMGGGAIESGILRTAERCLEFRHLSAVFPSKSEFTSRISRFVDGT